MKVLCQLWEESESGWGTRPDGYSLHKSEEDLAKYLKNHTDWLLKTYGLATPHEYDRPCGKPYWCEVSQEMFDKIIGTGIRLFDRSSPKEVICITK